MRPSMLPDRLVPSRSSASMISVPSAVSAASSAISVRPCSRRSAASIPTSRSVDTASATMSKLGAVGVALPVAVSEIAPESGRSAICE